MGVGKVGVGKVGVGKVGVGKVGVGKVGVVGKIGFGSREGCVSVLSMPHSTSSVTVVFLP